ncbi:hypothetical protein L2E82_41896, partial [Cichorium intybus]
CCGSPLPRSHLQLKLPREGENVSPQGCHRLSLFTLNPQIAITRRSAKTLPRNCCWILSSTTVQHPQVV